MDDLKSRAVSGVLWSLADRLGLQAVQFGVSVVLTRLLLPSEFGIIGMLALFMAIAQSLMDSGFGSALIQRQNADHIDESSIFYFNIAVGAALAAALCLSAPWIAAFYNQPLLVGLTRLMSLSLVFNGFGLVQLAVLTKRLDFKTQMKVGILACAGSGAIGVCLALSGWGVWSLAAQSVSNALLRSIILWVASPWRPALAFSLGSLKQMVGFGSRLALAGMLNAFFDNLYYAFIGKVFAATDLGYYTRANSMQLAMATTTTQTVSRVMFPALSTIQDDSSRLRQAYRRSLSMAVFANFPLMLGLAAGARPLITLLFTERWAPSVPYLQLLCLAGAVYPLHALNLNALQVKGRSDLFLLLEIVKKALIVVSMGLSYRWGILALLVGHVLVSFTSYLLNSHFSGRLVSYPMRQQLCDVAPYFFSAMGMGLVMLLVGARLQTTPVVHLVVTGGLGLLLYLGINYLFQMPALTDIVLTTRTRFGTRAAR